jgi:hypothetical protein
MSDLVEKVARSIQARVDTIVGHKDGPDGWKYYTREAHAAIEAVAEWIDEHHQIDKDGSVNLALTWQYTKAPESSK